MRTVMTAKTSASSTLAAANSQRAASSCDERRSICACAALTLRYSASISRATTAMKASWSRNRSIEAKVSGVFRARMRRASRGKLERGLLQPRPQVAFRRARAFGRDAVDVAVGFVELLMMPS